MGRKRHTPEQIIRKLQETEVQLAKGQPMAEVARKLGVGVGGSAPPFWRTKSCDEMSDVYQESEGDAGIPLD